MITVAGRLSGAGKLAKAVIAAGGTVEEMQPLKGRALSEWAARRAADHGLTPAIAAQVVRVTPPDLSIVDSELKKLAAYKASGAKLTPEAVAELLAGGREDEIFKLTDNLLPRPTAEALKIARSLTRGGLQPTSVAYRMARHVALVLQVRARQDRGESLSDVQEKMSEHRFVLQKAYDAAKDADPERLEAALRAIRDYEWEVKSGQVDAELGLDVCSRGSKPPRAATSSSKRGGGLGRRPGAAAFAAAPLGRSRALRPRLGRAFLPLAAATGAGARASFESCLARRALRRLALFLCRMPFEAARSSA